MPENTQPGSTSARLGEAAPNVGPSDTANFGPKTPGPGPRPAGGSGAAQDWVGKSLGKYRIPGVLGPGRPSTGTRVAEPFAANELRCLRPRGPWR
jgi:hypothetical protein